MGLLIRCCEKKEKITSVVVTVSNLASKRIVLARKWMKLKASCCVITNESMTDNTADKGSG